MWNRQPLYLGWPRRASSRTPDKSSGRPEADKSCGRPWATSGNILSRMASTIHGKINSGSSSSTDVSPAEVELPPPAFVPSVRPPAKLTSIDSAGEKHNVYIHFPKDPNCEVSTLTKFYESAMPKKSWRSGWQILNWGKIWWEDSSRPQSSQWRARIKNAALTCCGCARPGDSMDPKLSIAKPNQLRRRREVFDTSYTQKKPKIHSSGHFSSICSSLRGTVLESWEIDSVQIRNSWYCGTSCTTSKTRHFVSVGELNRPS